jgi:hypothetical protein
MSEEKVGIKEVKELLVAANVVAIKMIKLSKDGVSLSDLGVLVSDEELKNVLLEAAAGISKVVAEVKDIDAGEGIELAQVQLSLVPKILEALK